MASQRRCIALPENSLALLRSEKLKKQKRRTSGISTGYGKTGRRVCCLTYRLSTVRIRTAPGRFSDHSDCFRKINCSACTAGIRIIATVTIFRHAASSHNQRLEKNQFQLSNLRFCNSIPQVFRFVNTLRDFCE